MSKSSAIAKLNFSHSEALGALASAALVKLLLKCPAQSATFFGAWLKAEATAFGTTLSGSSLVEVVETPTTSSDGTARTPQNLSRLDTPPASPVPVFLNTDATGGTVLESGNTMVGERFKSCYWLMKPGTNYLVRVTNQSGGALTNGALKIEMGIISIPISDYLRVFGG
jgi:hypothetical protein